MADPHPVQLDVDYPKRLSRWKIFFKPLFAFPQAIVLLFVSFAFSFTSLFSAWAVLFTGRYPRGFFDFGVSLLRWQTNVAIYSGLMRDEYPPFTGTEGQYAPARLTIAYPERSSRLLLLVRMFTVIPALVFLVFVAFAGMFVRLVAWFAILFTGRIPKGQFDFLVGFQRLSARVFAYYYFMTDRYPPFGLA